MTVLLSILGGDGAYHRDFIELPARPEKGDCLRALGTVCRVVDIIHQTAPPLDPTWAEYLQPSLEFGAEILAVPFVPCAESEVAR